MKDYNLLSKILSVTTDNATNMDTLFEELEKLYSELGITFDSKNYRTRCFDHIMNLACQAMIRSIGDGDATEYPSDSESDNEDTPEASEKAKEVWSLKSIISQRMDWSTSLIQVIVCVFFKF